MKCKSLPTPILRVLTPATNVINDAVVCDRNRRRARIVQAIWQKVRTEECKYRMLTCVHKFARLQVIKARGSCLTIFQLRVRAPQSACLLWIRGICQTRALSTQQLRLAANLLYECSSLDRKYNSISPLLEVRTLDSGMRKTYSRAKSEELASRKDY